MTPTNHAQKPKRLALSASQLTAEECGQALRRQSPKR